MLALYPVLTDPHTGVSALGLAAALPYLNSTEKTDLEELPVPPEITGSDSSTVRMALLSLWLQAALRQRALWLPTTPAEWLDAKGGAIIKRVSGGFPSSLKDILSARWFNANLRPRRAVEVPWVRFVQRTFGFNHTANGFVIRASKVRLSRDMQWRRCTICTTVQPFNPIAQDRCMVRHGASGFCDGTTEAIDPTNDRVFRARKQHFRKLTERLDTDGDKGYAPHPFVAAEHSAALGDSGNTTEIARTEWHELRFPRP